LRTRRASNISAAAHSASSIIFIIHTESACVLSRDTTAQHTITCDHAEEGNVDDHVELLSL